ncbi:hypothetical protein [Skermanella pratensis]|uniref:hypothetical protein n=1 Tax=Skermanella pratensis TaxID=2233999 RepID=UPI0013012488|nr:hypothetical protein [Skermanella pratensis]
MRSLTSRSFASVTKTALLASACALSLSATVQAQTPPFAPLEVEIEGRILEIDPEGRTLTVMGTVIKVPESARISTPTNPSISWADVVGYDLPGKPDGFRNGTAIVIGESDGTKVTASDVSLNPEENVALGYITQNSNGVLKLDGMEIVLMPPRSGAASFPRTSRPSTLGCPAIR